MLTTTVKPFALVATQKLAPRKPKVLLTPTVDDVTLQLSKLTGDTYAVDFEATGLDVWDVRTQVVGTAIAGPEGCWYMSHVNGADPRGYRAVLDWMSTKKLVAHNVAYDGRLVLRDAGQWFNWVMCTYGMFRQLVQDRDPQFFSWSLDSLETEILGWPESHKNRMRELLTEHSLSKSDMCKLAWLEPEEFARYGALDAEAAWQAFTYFRQVLRDNSSTWGKTLAQYHTNEFLTLCRMLGEQNLRGMQINVPKLLDYKASCESKVAAYRK